MLATQTDVLRLLVPAMLVEPVGIDEPRGVVLRGLADGVQQSKLIVHAHIVARRPTEPGHARELSGRGSHKASRFIACFRRWCRTASATTPTWMPELTKVTWSNEVLNQQSSTSEADGHVSWSVSGGRRARLVCDHAV